MKKTFCILGILFVFACSKTEIPAKISNPVIQEEVIKFTTNYDSINNSNIIDTLNLILNISSKLPPSGIVCSISLTRNDNSSNIYKFDTSVNAPSISLKIPGFTIVTQYNLSISISSKNTLSNNLVKTITLSRNLIKKYISPDAWRNNIFVNDFSGFGSERVIWWDMDLDGQPDKINFVAPTPDKSNSTYLKIFKYNGTAYQKTIDVASLVRGDALNKFINDSLKSALSYGNCNIGVTDFNNDSIPDLIFSLAKQENQVGGYFYPSYQCVLISKGVLDYELKVFPIYFRTGWNDPYADFNKDGVTDFYTQWAVHSDMYFSKPNSTNMLGFFDKNLNNLSYKVLDDGSFQDWAVPCDLDKNGVTDLIIGGVDLGYNVYGPLGGLYHTGNGPRILMNDVNGSPSNVIQLIDKAFEDKWTSFGRFDETESVAFYDLNGDGFNDILVTKSHDTFNLQSNSYIDSLKGERLFEVFENQNGTSFKDATDKYFPNATNYLKMPHNRPGDFEPEQGKLIDADGDGLVDIVFPDKRYYFKNIKGVFVFQTNLNGFAFPSMIYKSSTNQ